MYTLFHVKNCFNKIILLENSINRYLIKKKNYTEFIYIPINLYPHNLWATRRLEMQKLGVVRGAGFRGGGVSLLTEAKQKGTVHHSVAPGTNI